MTKADTPIRVTICPPAFAAPCSATLNPVHALAIRAHSDALEERYQANAVKRRAPITYGKKSRIANMYPRRPHTPVEHPADIMEELNG